MKYNILKLSMALLCMIFVHTIYAQEPVDSTKQTIIDLPFGKVSENRLVGAVDVITSEDLLNSRYSTISAALAGMVPGYNQGHVRGYSRGGESDGPLVVVDGLSNRSISSLTIDEVESIHILKDVTAKMLYGSRAANGVIVVKTKRGLIAKQKFTLTAEYGNMSASDYPDFVGASDEMKYRNMAFMNDGKDPLYSDEDMALAGSSYKYPDVDYYDMFVNDSKAYQKINAQLIGGGERTQYFFNLGYTGQGGLEKVGDSRRTNILNVRSNLDYEVNKIISVNLDIAGRFFLVNGNNMSDNQLFTELSTRKPNDYPMFISDQPHVDSLGTSDVVNGKNLYGEMVYSGYKRQETSFAQTNIGMDFNLNDYVEGLSAKVYGTFDINNQIVEGKELTYRTLKPATTGPENERDTLIVNGVYNPSGNEKKLSDTYYRNMGGGAYLDYQRNFGDHAVMATLSYLVENKVVKTIVSDNDDSTDEHDLMRTIQDDKSTNFGLRANYAYKDKYVAEYSGSYMGSSRYHIDNRWKLFNAFGVSYIISQEDYMDNVDFIDYLKVKASYGTIGYDQSFDYLLFNNYYKYWAGSYKTGVKNSNTLVGTEFLQGGNKDLTYEESKEMNLGVSARIFNNTLALSAEVYKEERSGMPTVMQYAYPQLAGDPSVVANYNAIETKGFEFSAQYTNNIKDFTYSVGGYITSYKSEYTQFDELNDFSFQNKEGLNVGDIMGYVTDGFYTSAEDIATYGAEDGVPLTSSLGTVIPGDLKIKDLSDEYDEYSYNDNVINKYDKKVIGNSRPDFIYSLNINLRYKKLSLYARGQGVGPYDKMYNSPSYYTNKGNVKYSKFVYDAAVPTFDTDGNAVGLENNDYSLPRLTTEGSTHSYNGSTFFLKKLSYFKLRTVELNWELPTAVSSAIAAQRLNVFVRGTNLFTISNEKDLDPESFSAGLTNSPTFTTVTAGFNLVF